LSEKTQSVHNSERHLLLSIYAVEFEFEFKFEFEFEFEFKFKFEFEFKFEFFYYLVKVYREHSFK